jgi:hypothetical protein
MAGLLNAAELAACRALQESTFDTDAIQQRDPDDGWGTLAGPTTIATRKVRLATPTGPTLAQVVAMVGNVPAWVLTIAVDTDVKNNDRFLIGSDTFNVNGALQPHSYRTADRYVVTEVR